MEVWIITASLADGFINFVVILSYLFHFISNSPDFNILMVYYGVLFKEFNVSDNPVSELGKERRAVKHGAFVIFLLFLFCFLRIKN